MEEGVTELISVFMSYAHEDQDLRDELEKRLAMLKREGAISVWHDRRIPPGDEIDETIEQNLETADLILLLVSPDFLASTYCFDVEMQRAMERHGNNEARVLPVILRHCDWHSAPFGRLLATPPDGKPVKNWPDIDEALLHIVTDIRKAIKAIRPEPSSGLQEAVSETAVHSHSKPVQSAPRSSNLRVRKSYTEANKDRFLQDAFEYMAKFFENSLVELAGRDADIETSFKRIDARSFTAVIYRSGNAESRCCVMLGGPGPFTYGISYSMHDLADSNSFNESLSVEEGEQMLFLKPFGMMGYLTGGEKTQLTLEGAAEYYWSILINPLQR